MVTKSKGIGSNSAGLVPPDEAAILDQARLAFDAWASSSTLAGSATQRLAYAVMCEHAALADKGEEIATLAASTPGTEAFKLLTDTMKKFFIGAAPKTKDKDGRPLMTDDKFADSKVTRTAKIQLLGRAIKFATFMANKGVTFASFNVDKGAFLVPSSLLVWKDSVAKGRLAINKQVLLDNTSASVERPVVGSETETRTVGIRTSVGQVIAANSIASGRATGGETGEGEDGDAMPVRAEDLMAALHAIVCAKDGDKTEQVTYDAYLPKFWTQAGQFCAWFDVTIKAPGFKPAPKVMSMSQVRAAA